MAGALTAAIAAAFAGSASAADPYFEYTTLLLPGNGTNGAQNNTFLDGSTNNFTITRNGNTTQGTFSPFSQTGWGNYFDGADDFINVGTNYPSSLDLGSNNFTIEAFVYLSAATKQLLFGNLNDSSGTRTFFIMLNNTTAAAKYEIGLGGSIYSLGSGTIATNQWVHVCLMRSGTSIYLFENGVQIGTTQTFSGSVTSVANQLRVGGASTGQYDLSGYVSNLRMVIGSAVYSTSGFTPPTSPLTAITNTSLLICQSNRYVDNSSNGIAITPSGNTSVVAFSPFNPTASWSAATYGGSGYFDGNGDYLTAPANSSWVFTGDHTIEAWIYILSLVDGTIYATGGAGSADQFTYNSAGELYWANQGTPAGVIKVNTWNHVAASRSGTTLKIFVNGVEQKSATVSGTIGQNVTAWIGGRNSPFPNYVNSYICNLRVINGTAVYTGAFTPPTAPISTSGSASASAYPSTTNVNTSFASSDTKLLLNFTNAGIYDATSKNDLETVGNAQISTTQSKWGGSSISFDGTGDWLLIPDQPPQRIGTGNFTIEMWVYRNSSGTYGLAGKGTGTTGWLVSLNSSNQVVFTYGSSTITSSGTVSATTWTHIAVVREGTSTNQTKIYISGTNDGTGTVSTDFNQTNSMYIGADRTGGSAANAYVQDVRITNYARYTGNFTPPTAAFPTL